MVPVACLHLSSLCKEEKDLPAQKIKLGGILWCLAGAVQKVTVPLVKGSHNTFAICEQFFIWNAIVGHF